MRRYNKFTVPTVKAHANRRCLSETRATPAQRKAARQSTDIATSKWRTALRRCTVAEIAGLWTVTTWDGRQLISTPSLNDALAVAHC